MERAWEMDKRILRTVLRKRVPTWSSPLPPSTRSPRASSRARQNTSENSAISEILPKMILTSCSVIGGPRSARVDESEAVERVREDEPDELGGEVGRFGRGTWCPNVPRVKFKC